MEDMNGVEATQSKHERKPQVIGPLHLSTQTLRVSISLSNPTHPLPLPAPKPLFRTPYKHRILTRLCFDSSSEGR